MCIDRCVDFCFTLELFSLFSITSMYNGHILWICIMYMYRRQAYTPGGAAFAGEGRMFRR